MPLLGSVSGWGWGLGSQEKGKDHFRAPGLYLLSQIIQSSLHWFNSYYSWICWWAISCLLSSGSAFAPSQKLWRIYWALTPPAPESPQAPAVQAEWAPRVREKDAWHMVGPRALSAEWLNGSISRGDIPACPCSLPGHGHICPTLASCSLLFSSQTLHLKCIAWGNLLLTCTLTTP